MWGGNGLTEEHCGELFNKIQAVDVGRTVESNSWTEMFRVVGERPCIFGTSSSSEIPYFTRQWCLPSRTLEARASSKNKYLTLLFFYHFFLEQKPIGIQNGFTRQGC